MSLIITLNYSQKTALMKQSFMALLWVLKTNMILRFVVQLLF